MTRQPLRAPPLPSSEGSHTTSENTLAVCHRRRPHQVHSLLLQAVEFLDPARTQEPPCASQEICHLKSPPSNYFPDPRAMKLQPGQRGLQTACSHPTGGFPSAQTPQSWSQTQARRTGSSGLPCCTSQWPWRRPSSLSGGIYLTQELARLLELGPEIQAWVAAR